ncbi:gamma-glutamylcyclotransferase [Variovorax terrae]|uniref:glutathione-specific gamma-glutamylcyclotransferase n=1 Tax=Variovorax terrae TaxID=2923278 RepID=A0A9X1VS11_9BURK|nr:gamma-glutamylcyclotransferase [Variovorax terrae]MCJ0762310.1 gamma-glutamylcyclotransferase [Variovorax terrae]
MAPPLLPLRDPAPMLAQSLREWGGRGDLWVFGYASLIWRPEFDHTEHRLARVHGWHRALKMWSRINRGTPECPGLVFALLSGGSCTGMVFRVPRRDAADVMARLWLREMVTAVYDPRWLPCQTARGPVRALAFTLSRRSPSYTGELDAAHYRQIFSDSCGRFGTTLDYARQTFDSLRRHGIHDHALQRLLSHADGDLRVAPGRQPPRSGL